MKTLPGCKRTELTEKQRNGRGEGREREIEYEKVRHKRSAERGKVAGYWSFEIDSRWVMRFRRWSSRKMFASVILFQVPLIDHRIVQYDNFTNACKRVIRFAITNRWLKTGTGVTHISSWLIEFFAIFEQLVPDYARVAKFFNFSCGIDVDDRDRICRGARVSLIEFAY